MSNTVEFHIKIKGEGSNVLHDLTVEATGLDDIIAQVGEYAGAKSNPEVVAPLDKLKSLIGDSGSVAGMRMETRVRGRDLVMAIANETRINRKRTNIKL